MADLYTFGAVLSRIDQATDWRDSRYDHAQANPVEVARLHQVLREADRGAPKPQVFRFGLDAA
jgi:hypothetical protein